MRIGTDTVITEESVRGVRAWRVAPDGTLLALYRNAAWPASGLVAACARDTPRAAGGRDCPVHDQPAETWIPGTDLWQPNAAHSPYAGDCLCPGRHTFGDCSHGLYACHDLAAVHRILRKQASWDCPIAFGGIYTYGPVEIGPDGLRASRAVIVTLSADWETLRLLAPRYPDVHLFTDPQQMVAEYTPTHSTAPQPQQAPVPAPTVTVTASDLPRARAAVTGRRAIRSGR